MEQNNNDLKSPGASEMQHDNATGANQNEQGQASFTTGSTTGAGSNFGQGSSHLGAESYRQGDSTNAGANYKNEEGKLGASSVGTSNEGSSSEEAGAVPDGASMHVAGSHNSNVPGRNDGDNSSGLSNEKVMEGRNTSLEESTHLDTDNTTASRRAQSGSWSSSSDASDSE